MIAVQSVYLYHYFTAFARPALNEKIESTTLPEVKLNTKNWLRYHNETFGINISYPENWTYKESMAPDLNEFMVYFYPKDRTDSFSEKIPHITLWGKEGIQGESVPATSEQPSQQTDLNGNKWIFRDQRVFKHPGFRGSFAIVDLADPSIPTRR